MKIKLWLIVMTVLIVFSLVMTACQPAATPIPATDTTPAVVEPTAAAPAAPEPTAVAPVEEPMEPQVVTFAWTQEPDSLHPFYTDMWFSATLQQLYLCWAWEFDDQNIAYPNLVKEIPSVENGGISADGLTITLHLRDDIVWSDGEPITSADFKFTYDMLMDDANSVKL